MRTSLNAGVLSTVLFVSALVLSTILLLKPFQAALAVSSVEQEIQRLVLLDATLPRLSMAILCGAGLALSGTILQQVLRNPLASPDTLAVSAGARLSLGLTTLLAPGLFGLGRDAVAIAGAVASTVLVLAVARSRKYSPLSMILSGLLVSLYCGALSTVLVLVKDRYLVGLFIWGSGSLSQQSWEPTVQLAIRLAASCLPLFFLLRPLSILDAGEEVAKNVGVPVARVRLLAIGLAVSMAAFVTSTVGMIGFIGLAAPALTALCGVRRFSSRCLWSAILGALLLLVTDLAVQLIAGTGATFVPTGAVTAVVGSPLLLILLSRFRSREPQPLVGGIAPASSKARRKQTSTKIFWGTGLLVGLTLVVLIGRAPDGSWSILHTDLFAEVLPWRLPRMLGAAGAGSLLAVAGYILQRVTQNPMASPEIMGVSAGAILGAAVSLFFIDSPATIGLGLATMAGSFFALLFVLGISLRRSIVPEQILLAGVALTALVDALVGLFSASGNPSSILLLAWMAGSDSGISLTLAAGTIAAALALLIIALLGARWLSILPLGTPTASGLGVNVSLARSSLLVLVAVITAVATPVIGPLTFVGLMAPHTVSLLRVRTVSSGLLLSSLAGASLMMLADALARTIAFPLQLPTGILASLLAGPLLLFLIAMGDKR